MYNPQPWGQAHGLCDRKLWRHQLQCESASTGQKEFHNWRDRWALKLALTAPPVDGAANEACVEYFSKSLKVPRSSVTIASGERNRLKVVRVHGVTAKQFWERISSQ